MSPASAFMYNFLTMGVIFPWTFVWAPQAFPGCSVWIACLFATLLELPIAIAYVYMATAMPRSGGDYVFQSRVLGGAVGMPVVTSGLVTWFLQWMALSMWLMCVLGIAPMLMGLGVHYENMSLINAAVWVQSPTGIVLIGAVGMAAMAVLLITGLKNYVRLQYAMFSFTAIMIVIVVVQFLRTTPESFAAAINHFSAIVDNNPDYYSWIQNDVAATGYNINPAFALGATILAAPIAWTSTQWAAYSVEQGGEIKGASAFKNQLFIIVGSLVAVGLCLALIAWTEERAVGTSFFNAVSASYYGGVSQSGSGIGSVFPFPGIYAIAITPNPILIVLVCLAFILGSLQVTCNAYIGVTRMMLAMSLDRTLPSWISKVNARFASPVRAIVVYCVLGFLVSLGYNYLGSWYMLTLGVTFAAGYVICTSTLSATLMPFRAKSVYLASPGGHHKIFGLPAVTVIGAIGFCLGVSAEIAFLAESGYGLRGTVPYIVVGGVLAGWIVFYWICRAFNQTRGIDVSYAFKEIPPE